MLCKYKHIFGKEKEGVHSFRIFNVAIVDVIATILVTWFISNITKLNFLHILFIAFLLSIIVHKLFCVNSTWTNFIFHS